VLSLKAGFEPWSCALEADAMITVPVPRNKAQLPNFSCLQILKKSSMLSLKAGFEPWSCALEADAMITVPRNKAQLPNFSCLQIQLTRLLLI
jgi:hypothetical protein